MRVIGLDLSLTSTGIASIGPGGTWVDKIKSSPIEGDASQLRRLRYIRDHVISFVSGSIADLVVVEALAISRQTGQHLTRAGLWHVVMETIDRLGQPWVEVGPTVRAKYATGRGNAGKDEVLAAVVRRFPAVDVRGNDEADALTLAAMGADWLGCPLVDMPAAHRVALEKIRWPELISA